MLHLRTVGAAARRHRLREVAGLLSGAAKGDGRTRRRNPTCAGEGRELFVVCYPQRRDVPSMLSVRPSSADRLHANQPSRHRRDRCQANRFAAALVIAVVNFFIRTARRCQFIAESGHQSGYRSLGRRCGLVARETHSTQCGELQARVVRRATLAPGAADPRFDSFVWVRGILRLFSSNSERTVLRSHTLGLSDLVGGAAQWLGPRAV